MSRIRISPSTTRLLFFYLFAFAISWIFWWGMSRAFHGGGALSSMTLVFSTIGALGPLLSLWIMGKLSHGAVRLGAILGTIRIRGVDRRWFVPAALAVPVLVVVGNLVNTLLGREATLQVFQEGPARLGIAVLPVMLLHFAAALFTSPLFEEPGWRGFALPQLQQRFGREIGSLVVGSLWWLWHQPMNMTFGIEPTVYGFFYMVLQSFLIDSLFNLSGRNLATAMLAHQSMGTTIMFLYAGRHNPVTLALLVVAVIVLRLRERKVAPVPPGAQTA